MANNDSSALKAKTKKVTTRRRSARIADIVATSGQSPQPKASTSRDRGAQSKSRTTVVDNPTKRKRDSSITSSVSSTSTVKSKKSKVAVKPASIPRPKATARITCTGTKRSKKSKPTEPTMESSNNDGADANQNNNSNSRANPASGNSASSALGYLEADERELGRLHALLENRGLPSQLFNALHSFGPRVHQLLQRQIGSGMLHQVQLLNDGLLSSDENQQMASAVEMSQMLVMGNEESLATFPIQQIVPTLIVILRNHHNFALVNHVCRALTYMMESLPRSSTVIVQATPVFLEKLQVIQCIDVAEQSLSALAKLSKRHAPYLLKVGAVSTCLQFIDFFSIPSQRTALTITLNCCAMVNEGHSAMIKESINLLIDRLNQQDQRSLELVCQSLISLVENLKNDASFMKCLLKHSLINKLQPLLILTPQVINSQTFMQLVHMLVVMCSICPEVAVALLNNDIADTLFTLLVCNSYSDGRMDLARRSPQETYQLITLISELMPCLPKDGVFSVDIDIIEDDDMNVVEVDRRSATAQWQWKNNCSQWVNYSHHQSKAIELAFRLGEYEMMLISETNGHQLSVVLGLMSQLDEENGEANTIRRNLQLIPKTPPVKLVAINLSNDIDCRITFFKENPQMSAKFIKKLFIVLYQVYNSSAGPSVRHRCLQALLRMIYDAPSTLLTSVISCPMISNCIASMLTSDDIRAIVSGLQMATILMQKLPKLFTTNFRREGVLFQIKHLTKGDYFTTTTTTTITDDDAVVTPPATTSAADALLPTPAESSRIDTSIINISDNEAKAAVKTGGKGNALMKKRKNSKKSVTSSANTETFTQQRLPSFDAASTSTSTTTSTSPMLTNSSSTGSVASGGGRILRNKKKSSQSEASTSTAAAGSSNKGEGSQGLTSRRSQATTAAASSSQASRPVTNSSRRQANSNARALLGNLFSNSRWKSNIPHESMDQTSIMTRINVDELRAHKETAMSAKESSKAYAKNRSNVKLWIGKQAKELISQYFTSNSNDINDTLSLANKLNSMPEMLTKLTGESREDIKNVLELISEIMMKSDATAFELMQCGLVDAMIEFFNKGTDTSYGDGTISKEDRLQMFCDTFCNKSLMENGVMKLVERLIDCLHHNEQFYVKVLDIPEGGTSCMKFINNNQLKCLLVKHPDCNQLKAWKGGPVKIDPLAVMSSIEHYLIHRGYTTSSDELYSDDETEDDDEDLEENLAASMPSNHRIEFLIDNKPLPWSMTIYEAVRLYSQALARNTNNDCLSTSQIWAHSHILQYRYKALEKVSSEPTICKTKSKSTTTKQCTTCNDSSEAIRNIINESVVNKVTFTDPSLSILTLLKIINNLLMHGNKYIENPKALRFMCESLFHSSKLDVKVSRQVKDPLVVLTADLPVWIGEICKICPFLIPFSTREIVFASTGFDRIRLLVRLQESSRDQNNPQNANSNAAGAHSNSNSRMMPRLERKKRVVDRSKILQQAEIIFKDLASDKSLLELQYSNEVGTGLGPTLEFYSLVSKELQRADLDLWRGDVVLVNKPTSDNDIAVTKISYNYSENGLFFKPLPIFTRHKNIFSKKRNIMIMLGQMMAKSLHDSRMIDIPLSMPFYKWLLGMENTMTVDDLEQVDITLAATWRKLQTVVNKKTILERELHVIKGFKHDQITALTLDGCSIEDLSLDFTLPGYPAIDLVKNGNNVPVNIYNLEEYLNLVLQFTLVNCVKTQFEFVKKGFRQVFSLDKLKFFYPYEMDQLFCGSNYKQWTVEELMKSTKCDHGYNIDSQTIVYLFSVLAAYDYNEQREFLQFITGSARLPIGGLSSLSPQLTIVKKIVDEPASPDDYLPSVMTCANYLKLPAYSNPDILRIQLKKASTEGIGSFHLS